MNKITKQDKETLLLAAELIFQEHLEFSCIAIDCIFQKYFNGFYPSHKLVKQYCQFYSQPADQSWFPYEPQYYRHKEERTLLLLLFREVGEVYE